MGSSPVKDSLHSKASLSSQQEKMLPTHRPGSMNTHLQLLINRKHT